MTVARNTKSYPYLAIAQHYNVDYGKVLWYAEMLVRKTNEGQDCYSYPPASQWRYEVWRLERNKFKINGLTSLK